jgi:uncharacterized protein (DUF4415 family)
MKTTAKLKKDEKPTREQLDRIERAAKMPIVHDEDSPVYTSKQLSYLYLETKRLSKKQTVGIRLNIKTLEKYKGFGKGYTGIMAAVLDYAIRHPDMIQKAL